MTSGGVGHHCSCAHTHHCSDGSCTTPGHTCDQNTVAPTASPSPLPTPLPTPAPSTGVSTTAAPTVRPSAAPTELYPRDVHGVPVFPTDAAGNEVLATDAHGRPVVPRDRWGQPVYPATIAPTATPTAGPSSALSDSAGSGTDTGGGGGGGAAIIVVIVVAAIIVLAVLGGAHVWVRTHANGAGAGAAPAGFSNPAYETTAHAWTAPTAGTGYMDVVVAPASGAAAYMDVAPTPGPGGGGGAAYTNSQGYMDIAPDGDAEDV